MRLSVLPLVLPLLSLANPARADEPAGEGAGPENGVSARMLFGVASVPDEGDFPLVGAGVAYERDFYDLIAVELALEALMSPVAQTLLLELVVEKPIELNDTVGVYFGGGPTAALHIIDGQARPGAGGLALFGVEAVIAGDLEVFVELDAALLYFDRPVLEADVGTGVLYRF